MKHRLHWVTISPWLLGCLAVLAYCLVNTSVYAALPPRVSQISPGVGGTSRLRIVKFKGYSIGGRGGGGATVRELDTNAEVDHQVFPWCRTVCISGNCDAQARQDTSSLQSYCYVSVKLPRVVVGKRYRIEYMNASVVVEALESGVIVREIDVTDPW